MLVFLFIFICFVLLFIYLIYLKNATQAQGDSRSRKYECVVLDESWYYIKKEKQMNVKELIARLQTLPQDAKVYIFYRHGDSSLLNSEDLHVESDFFDPMSGEDGEMIDNVVSISV